MDNNYTSLSNDSGAVVENDTQQLKTRQDSLASAASTSSTLAHDGEGSDQGARSSTQGSERTWTPTTEQVDDRGVLGKTESAQQSVTESMPWYREVLFVGTICLSQLFTRK